MFIDTGPMFVCYQPDCPFCDMDRGSSNVQSARQLMVLYRQRCANLH